MANFVYPGFAPRPAPARIGRLQSLLATERAADEDPLTGLATRHRLIDRLGCLMSNACSKKLQPGLLLLDLDRFKTTNDGLGPLIGDKLLCRVAARLQSLVARDMLLARISGDSFAVLLNDSRDAPALAPRLLEFMCRPFAVSGHAVTLGASIGVAIAGRDGSNSMGVLHAADLALHQAQREGQNRIRFYDPSMQERAVGRRSLESDFRASVALQQVELVHALTSDQFAVHYQPVVSLADGHLTGFEALLRWNHPERGMVMPGSFIPLAEETGLINLLGEWVLRTACRDAASWPISASATPLRIAVNVSPLQLRRAELAAGNDRKRPG